VKWLNRDLILGPYVTLCTTEEEYREAVAHCKTPLEKMSPWVNDGADATTHSLENTLGEMVCIVTIRVIAGEDPVAVAAMLVHEAVHVWQRWRASIGEHAPSKEFEAYSIQIISQRLMQAYADRLGTP
jgi:hypothetical protein